MNTLTTRAHQPANFGSTLRRAGQRIWRVLEQHGQDRAQRHLLDFARQCESLQPELAKDLRAASRSIG